MGASNEFLERIVRRNAKQLGWHLTFESQTYWLVPFLRNSRTGYIFQAACLEEVAQEIEAQRKRVSTRLARLGDYRRANAVAFLKDVSHGTFLARDGRKKIGRPFYYCSPEVTAMKHARAVLEVTSNSTHQSPK